MKAQIKLDVQIDPHDRRLCGRTCPWIVRDLNCDDACDVGPTTSPLRPYNETKSYRSRFCLARQVKVG